MQEWVGGSSSEFESIASIYGKGCVEAIFRCKTVKELFDDRASVKDSYLSKLQQIWKRVWRTPVYPEPLNLSHVPLLLSLSGENRITTYTSFLESEISTRLGNADIARLITTFTLTHSDAATREVRRQPYQLAASRSGSV
jgi:hypothetical protein